MDSGSILKWANPVKINKNCPARIITTNSEERINVYFQRTHVGHTQTIRFLKLTMEERDELARKIKQGVTFGRILDDIREAVESSGTISRLQLTDRRDLRNIVRDYHLDKDVAHPDDAFSVHMWVEQQKSLGKLNPILYFKMQENEDKGSLLDENDFMLVLITPYQVNQIANYATDKVLIDSMHNTSDYDFQLTTLLTVNEFGAGCPFAFCLSNRIDSTAMKLFFESVKTKVGPILTNVLMTDDAPTYINAWTEIMSKPKHHLLYNWHIDKNWRNNLSKIKDNIKKSEVYKTCRMLMECLDIEDFEDSLEAFLV